MHHRRVYASIKLGGDAILALKFHLSNRIFAQCWSPGEKCSLTGDNVNFDYIQGPLNSSKADAGRVCVSLIFHKNLSDGSD